MRGSTQGAAEFAVSSPCIATNDGVYFDRTPIRSTGGLGRQSVNGCDEEDYYVTVPSRLSRGGRHVVCVHATNNNDYGQALAHISCRRFRG